MNKPSRMGGGEEEHRFELMCRHSEKQKGGSISRARIGFETIAESTHGVNQSHRLAFVDFAAEEPDESIERIFLDILRGTPDGIENGAARGDFAFPAHKEFEEAKFGGRKVNLPLGAQDPALGDVQGKIRDAER